MFVAVKTRKRANQKREKKQRKLYATLQVSSVKTSDLT